MGILTTTFKNLGNFINENTSTVMTGVGVGGLIATGVLSGTGALNADRRLREAREKNPEVELGKVEVFKTYAICLLPAVLVGAASIGMIIGANVLDMKDKAALGAMVVAGEKKFKDYKSKVEEKLGVKKEKELSKEIVTDEIRNFDATTAAIEDTGNGNTLFKDCQTGGYFKSSIEAVRRAVNDLNYELISRAQKYNNGLDIDTDVYVTLNDFRGFLGLKEVECGKFIGYGLQESGSFEIEEPFTVVETKDGQKCILLQYDMYSLREKDWRQWH
jgi:hypothetical protein